MNSKRWIAIALAIAIVIIMGSVNSSLKTKDEDRVSKWSDYLSNYFNDKFSERVITQGDLSNRIMIVRINGIISDSYSMYGYDHSLTLNALNTAYNDDTVKGVILAVDSPGGGVYESAEIKDKIRKLNDKGTPVYAVFGSMAASGGYYVSAYADKIYASRDTLTGSIGVIMSSMDVSELLERIGVKNNVIKSAEHKDIMSSTRPMTPIERKYMQELIDNSYERFIKVVSEGRDMSESKVKKIADGRVFDGEMAKANGLIDEIGSMELALSDMGRAIEIENPEIFEITDSFTLYMKYLPRVSSEKTDYNELYSMYSELSKPKLLYLYGE